MPDGAIQQLFPLSGFSRDEAYLEPGQTHLVTTICYVAAPPFGNEVLKLFATPAPIDFDPILTTRGPARSSVQGAGPLEQLLAEIHAGARSAVGSVPTGMGSTHAVKIKGVPGANQAAGNTFRGMIQASALRPCDGTGHRSPMADDPSQWADSA